MSLFNMKNLKIYLSIFLTGAVIMSCQETVVLDIENSEPQVVIEGLITNSDLNFIKVTKSREFYDSGESEKVTDATVVVTVNGEDNVFVHNPDADPLYEGVYLPPTGFAPSIGNTYHMSVIVEGEEYEAEETLLPVTTIDSLTVRLDEEEMVEPEVEGRFYEVLFYAQEPQDRIDHYLFKFYRNDTIVKDHNEEIYFSEDKFLGEEIDDLPVASYYAIGDTVRVEMYSLTRESYVFYADVFNLINGDGGMFSPPPSNPRNNISNDGLGYFQVSAIDSETIIVEDPGN
jgi:Domain of unknown function (DUF4249)